MTTNLVIVESPAKCQKIQGFLGPGWKVIASMGHIRALEEDLDAVGLSRDFEPKFQFLKEKAKAIAQLKEAAQGIKKVYLAADDDREGEAIAFSVAILLKLPLDTTARAVFHEITEKAVKDAVAAPRTLDMNRVNAQQARAVLDMMVGYTISPLLWRHIGHALSAGRCQTPALRIVAEKEQEITSFKSSASWRIKGTWKNKALTFDAAMAEDLEDQENAMNYIENLYNATEGKVTNAETRGWTESAPKPLITSTLQQEASALHGCNPKLTMSIAQRLYEAGHITYMRTDMAVLCEEATVAAKSWVSENVGKEYVGGAQQAVQVKQEPKKKKKTETVAPEAPKAQEAHEAIRPTHFEARTLPTTEDWSAKDRQIYGLIWTRAIQSVMATARGETRKVVLRATEDPCEFDWATTFKRTTFEGWKKLGKVANLDDAEEAVDAAEAQWTAASALVEGSSVNWTTMEAYPYETKAGARYTEATLVRELEKKGIGRPSTFAALIAAILDKGYVEKKNTPAQKVQRQRFTIQPNQWPPNTITYEQSLGGEKDKLIPTDLGKRVIGFCVEKFGDLFDYSFTSQMETRLDKIAVGTEQWKQVLRDTWASYKDRYETLKKTDSVVPDSRNKLFADGLKAVQSKKGPLLLRESPDGDKEKTQFYGWPEGVTWDQITAEAAAAHIATKAADTAALGTLDGKPVEKKKGPFGTYVKWGTMSMTIKGDETFEQIEALLRAKAATVAHTLGPFEFRTGQYGLYMFKKDVKDKKFVGLPEGLDPKSLTEEAAVKIYQAGLQQKKRSGNFGTQGQTQGQTQGRGGWRGRGRGRGRGH